MKCALVLLAALAVLGVCSAYGIRTTPMPCPKVCPKLYAPVCVEDMHGQLLSFSNSCMKRMCECRINRMFKEMDMDVCDKAVPKPPRDMCPVWLRSGDVQGEGSQQDLSSSSDDTSSDSANQD